MTTRNLLFADYGTLVYVVTPDSDFPALEGTVTPSGVVDRLRREVWDD